MKIKKFISQLKSVLISKDSQGDMEERIFSRCINSMGIIPMFVTLIALPIPLRIIISLIHLKFSYNSNQLFSDINFGMFHSALIYATLHALLILIILRRQRGAI